MSQVRTNASAYEPTDSGATLTAPSLPRTGWLLVLLLGAAAGSLVLATRAPLATTVIGLIVFGVLHNVLEIRYVAGRFGSLLTGRFLIMLLTLITGIVVCRLAAGLWYGPARTAEVLLGFGILAVGCWMGLRRLHPGWLALAWTLLAIGCVVSVAMPGYYFVVLTHLHNLVPLVFLWEWAVRLPALGDRWLFRGVQVLWIVVLPLLILAGVFDALIVADPGVAARFVGDGTKMIAATAPPDVWAQLGLRFLVMFAFMQTMHYVVWVAFLPRFAPDAIASFDAKVPWLRGGRAWIFGLVAGGLLAVIFFADYFQGRALYGALASYHAYLEFPVLLALLLAGGRALTAPR